MDGFMRLPEERNRERRDQSASKDTDASILLSDSAKFRWLGRQPWPEVARRMQRFAGERKPSDADEIWFCEHHPVFTLGVKTDPSHILDPGDIPVEQSDRGGQVTYHGPGQLMVYPLLNLRRARLGPRSLVCALEAALIDCAAEFGIKGARRAGAPGVYVAGAKLAAIGLRLRRGCSYHGMALNVCADLRPFARINPCGFAGLQTVNFADLGGPADPSRAAERLKPHLLGRLYGVGGAGAPAERMAASRSAVPASAQ